MKKSLCALVLVCAGLHAGCALGQAPPVAADTAGSRTAPLVYDAVAIKPNNAGSNSTRISTRDATFQATNVSIKMLLVNASGIRDGLISGLPGWAETSRYDINAKILDFDPKVTKSVSTEQRRAMMAKLLAERFGVKTHIEIKTLPVYELVVIKDGPKFKENVQLPQTDSDAAPPDPTKPRKMGPGSMSVSNTEMTAAGVPISNLTNFLSNQLDRTVIDKTGLSGKYDLHLNWASDDPAAARDPDAEAARLFTALQEQLGLKLQPAKGPVETLVVDEVKQPTEN